MDQTADVEVKSRGMEVIFVAAVAGLVLWFLLRDRGEAAPAELRAAFRAWVPVS